MARSFLTLVVQASRAAERSHKAAVRAEDRARRQEARELERQARERQRLEKESEREAKAIYVAQRQADVDRMNDRLRERIDEFRSLLVASVASARPLDFKSLRKVFSARDFAPEGLVGRKPIPPTVNDFKPQKPGAIARFFGGEAKYEAAKAEGLVAYKRAKSAYRKACRQRKMAISRARVTFVECEKARKQAVVDHNATIDEFECGYRQGERECVREHFSYILERSTLPEGFPEQFRIAYVPESKQVVVEHQLPARNIVPNVAEYRYVKSKDEIREKARRKGDIGELYCWIIGSVTLRVLNEIFSSDIARTVDVAVFNGITRTINPSTGEEIAPCVISLRATRDEFTRIVLERVDPIACVQELRASVSRKTDELAPVRPVIEFDMIDARFVPEEDLLSGLDTIPNIMDLNPFEFEHLVTNLFNRIGLETKLTRSSRDGGVDAVAYDARPIFGGKVVIQAKRYKNVVEVGAVRDLYGTMMNEGANKGILVTTSHYGPDSYKFAKDKPIELIEGSVLLHLLDQQGIRARIIMPDKVRPFDWHA